MNPLLDLARFGQSYWLDDLTRPMIESGELQRRVTNEGRTGVTANPSIFRAALHASGAYDRQIRELAVHPLNGIYEALIVADVRDACDILTPGVRSHAGGVMVPCFRREWKKSGQAPTCPRCNDLRSLKWERSGSQAECGCGPRHERITRRCSIATCSLTLGLASTKRSRGWISSSFGLTCKKVFPKACCTLGR